MIWVPELGMAIANAGELSEAFFQKVRCLDEKRMENGRRSVRRYFFGFHAKKDC